MTNISTKDFRTKSFPSMRVSPVKEQPGRYSTLNKIRKPLDVNISSRKIDSDEFLEDKLDTNISSRKIDSDEFLEDKLDTNISSRKIDSDEFLEDKLDTNISSRKRRLKGTGSGCIYYRKVTKKGKEYQEAYYQYEFWDKGDCLLKSSKYIQKKLLGIVHKLNQSKAPVREILEILGEII